MKKILIPIVTLVIVSVAIYAFLLLPPLKQNSNTKAEPSTINNTFLGKVKKKVSVINNLKNKKENTVNKSLKNRSAQSKIKLNSSMSAGKLQENEQILIGKFIDADNLESIQTDDDAISIGEYIDVDKLDDSLQEDAPQSIGEFIDIDIDMSSEDVRTDDKKISVGKFINVNDLNNIVKEDEGSVSIGEFIPLE